VSKWRKGVSRICIDSVTVCLFVCFIFVTVWHLEGLYVMNVVAGWMALSLLDSLLRSDPWMPQLSS
jgi:hypothetical protein